MLNSSFKSLEENMNNIANSLSIPESTYPGSIKNFIFEELKKHYPSISEIDIHYNKFVLRYNYEHDYLNFKKYDDGHIDLVFSISTKRTDTLRAVSKTKNKYVHTSKENPIKFFSAQIYSYVPSFDWVSDDPKDIRVSRNGYSHSNNLAEKIKGSSLEDVLEKIKDTYPVSFRSDVVQPFLKNIIFTNRKSYAIFEAIPNDLKIAIENKDNDAVFDGIKDFILSNDLCSV